MAAIDTLKADVLKLTASQSAFNTTQTKLLADVLTKLNTPGGASEQDIQDVATTLEGMSGQIDQNTQTLSDFDQKLGLPAEPPAQG